MFENTTYHARNAALGPSLHRARAYWPAYAYMRGPTGHLMPICEDLLTILCLYADNTGLQHKVLLSNKAHPLSYWQQSTHRSQMWVEEVLSGLTRVRVLSTRQKTWKGRKTSTILWISKPLSVRLIFVFFFIHSQARSAIRETRLISSLCLSVSPSSYYQSVSQCTDLCGIWYWGFVRTSVDKHTRLGKELMSLPWWHWGSKEQDGRCTYNVILLHVCVTTVARETQQFTLCVIPTHITVNNII